MSRPLSRMRRAQASAVRDTPHQQAEHRGGQGPELEPEVLCGAYAASLVQHPRYHGVDAPYPAR